MRVLLTIRHFPPDGGGAEVVALNVSKRLIALGVPVRILTGRYFGRPSQEKINGIPVRRHFVGPYVKGMHEFFYLLSFAWYLISHRHEYDIIHTFQVNLSTFVAIVLGALLKKTVVGTAHCSGKSGDTALWGRIPLGNTLLKCVASRIDGCTGVSMEVRDELQKAGFDQKRTWYVPNGVTLQQKNPARSSEFRKRFGIPDNMVVGVFVGRISRQKAPTLLIQAWAAALRRQKALHLIVVGDGELRSAIESHVQQMSMGPNVSFTGWVDNVGDYLKSADFFLLPSLHEGMPMALLEAMATGLPAVASDVGGVGDVIEHQKNGLLFKTGDLKAFTEHIVSLGTSSDLRKRLGDEAKKTIENEFSLDSSCRQYLRFYESVWAKRHADMVNH